MPGLVNAHTHLQYTDFAELAESELSLPDWIRKLTAKRSAFTEADWVESTRRGIHMLLRTGTTAVTDIATDRCALMPPARAGLAGISYLEASGDDQRWRGGVRDWAVTAIAGAPSSRRVGVSPHTLYSVDTYAFTEYLALARLQHRRVHTHLAESAAETEYVLAGTGPFASINELAGFDMALMRDGGAGVSPTVHLDSLHGLGPDVHVAHGVHCGPEDRALLRERGTAVALCVRSNAILHAGEAPVAAYLAEGSPIALGTDSLASSPSLDLLEEAIAVRETAIRQGYDDRDLSRRVVEAATLGGADAMGLPDVGRLAAGGRADMTVFDVPVVDPDESGWDPYAVLLDHGTGRCVATVLGGKVVHRAM
jgi:cytosine/adenosine deaminase-related metal-dependent hydrolase